VLILEIKAKLRIENNVQSKIWPLSYTSGTTGRPKGVMLSHQNIFKRIGQCSRILLKQEKPCISFLPICHIFERMILYLYQYYGVSIYFGESIDKISDNLKKLDQLSLLLFQDFLEYTIKFTPKETELTG
jgi:long-chain acyl-CoA synthetase